MKRLGMECLLSFDATPTDIHCLRLVSRLLEKKYQDQMRILEAESTKERELMIVQTVHLRQDIDKQMGSFQEQMAKLRKNVAILEEVSRIGSWRILMEGFSD